MKIHRIAVTVMGVGTLIGMLATGCSKPTADQGATSDKSPTPKSDAVEVAFVTNSPSNFWTIARKGVEAASKEEPGVHVQFVMPADGTAATQKSMVDDLLAKGVKALAISPVDPKNQTDWLNEVANK